MYKSIPGDWTQKKKKKKKKRTVFNQYINITLTIVHVVTKGVKAVTYISSEAGIGGPRLKKML